MKIKYNGKEVSATVSGCLYKLDTAPADLAQSSSITITDDSGSEKAYPSIEVLFCGKSSDGNFYFGFREVTDEEVQTRKDERMADTMDLIKPMLPKWESGKSYAVGDYVSSGDCVYRVIQAHTSQADWAPNKAPAMFSRIYGVDPETGETTDEAPEWVQPDSTTPYAKGDKVTHNGKTWESTVDSNVWEPGVYGWTET